MRTGFAALAALLALCALAACGADGPPVAPSAKSKPKTTGITITGEARVGIARSGG